MPNDGHHSFPKFLRRQQLPKDSPIALQDIGSRPARFYTDADFTVGDRCGGSANGRTRVREHKFIRVRE